MSLSAPLPGEKPSMMAIPPADAEAEGAAFMAAMSATQGGR